MNLKTDQNRYRVFEDKSYEAEKEDGKLANRWRYYELRGRFGVVYPFSETHLAVQLNAFNSPLPGRVKAEHPDWTVIQSGDLEIVFKLPNKDFEAVAQLSGCRRKRFGNPENAQRLAKFWFKPIPDSSAMQTEEK